MIDVKSPLRSVRVLTGLISASVITTAAGHGIGLGAAALSFLMQKQTFIRETETPLEQPSFNIKFGRVARTLVYEDRLGTLSFVFDISPAQVPLVGKWKLHLCPRPLIPDGDKYRQATTEEDERVALALERTKEYAASRGYVVELSG